MLGRAWACLAAVAALLLAWPGHAAGPPRPEIWLTPFAPYAAPGDERHGAPDYFDLFEPAAAWAVSAARTKVFKIYRDQAVLMPDDRLKAIIDRVRDRHLALAMESNILIETSACGPGVGKFWPITPVLERLKRLGADLRYLALNEPLTGGHAATGPNACRASIEAVAADTAAALKPLWAVYPALQVGDIEPIGVFGGITDWPEQIGRWMAAYQAATGRPLAFMQADTVWGRDWKHDLLALARITRAAHIPFGVLYDGDFTELSDADWAADTARYASEVEDGLGLHPDQVNFQTWDEWPQHSLPDSDFTTMTGMVRAYLRPRTALTRLDGTRFRLTDERGAPIAGAALTIEQHDDPPDGPLLPQRMEGEVPQHAVSALFALRVNAECTCPRAPVDLVLSGIRYGDGGPAFAWDLAAWTRAAPAAVRPADDGSERAMEVRDPPGTPLVLNGPSFPVRAGAHFDLRFGWAVSRASSGAGYAALIFLGADGIEVRRTLHRLATTWRQVGSVTTDADGVARWPGAAGTRSLALSYAGTVAYRATMREF